MKRNGAFVPAVEPAPVTATPARPAPTADSVAAKWRDNLGAWIGVTVLLSAGYALLRIGLANVGMMPLPGAEHSAWSFGVFTLIGGVAFGWLMAWRSSLDERERQGEIDGMVARIEDDAEYIEQLEEKVTELETKLAYAQRDLQERIVLQQQYQAQKQRTYTPSAQVAEDAVPFSVYDKARQLVERACRNLPASKDKVCTTLGWTQSEWREAHQLAQDAGLFRVVGNRTELLVDDLDTALAIMDVYAGFSSVGLTD